MIGQNHLFSAFVGLFLTLALGLGLTYGRMARRLVQTPDVLEIFRRLRPVDRPLLRACDPWQPSELDAGLLFEGLGGLDGLEALSANCAVLIDLACYVQRWYPEALPVAEQLRLNAREFEWHLDRLRGAALRGRLRSAYPDYALKAVALYCSMTRHVVELYETTQVPGWAEVVNAL